MTLTLKFGTRGGTKRESSMSSERSLIQELSALRAVVGPDAKEGELLLLIEKHKGDVQRAVAEFFDGPQDQDHAPPPTAVARPAEPSPVTDQDLVQVTTPQGMRPGQQLQVHTPSGTVRVTIPQGVVEGQIFLVRCPPPALGHAAQSGAGYSGYPGVQRPVVRFVRSHPYTYPYSGRCGPYGYRYGPRYGYNDRCVGAGVGAGVGLFGGLLIADALFW